MNRVRKFESAYHIDPCPAFLRIFVVPHSHDESRDADPNGTTDDDTFDPAAHPRPVLTLSPLIKAPRCRKQILRQRDSRQHYRMACEREVVDLDCGSETVVPQSVFPPYLR